MFMLDPWSANHLNCLVSLSAPKSRVSQGISAMGIMFLYVQRRDNRCSLAIFDRKDMAHLEALETRDGSEWARSHSAAEIAGFFASPAAKKIAIASDRLCHPQNRRELAATTTASRRSCAISRPQQQRDTKVI